MPKSEAFDELYAATRERLTVQLTALAGDRSEAQDLVQEAFVRAWIRWDTVGAYDDPEGWIRRVAFNLGVSRWRRARRLVLRPSPSGALPSASGPDVGWLLVRRSRGVSLGVIGALQALPVPERRAVILHHVAGLSVEEVAAEVGSPVGTVKSRLSRGEAPAAGRARGKGRPQPWMTGEPGQSGLSGAAGRSSRGGVGIAGRRSARGILAGGSRPSAGAETGAEGGTG